MKKFLFILGSILLCVLIFIIAPYYLIKSSFSSSCDDNHRVSSVFTKECGSINDYQNTVTGTKMKLENSNSIVSEERSKSEAPTDDKTHNIEMETQLNDTIAQCDSTE